MNARLNGLDAALVAFHRQIRDGQGSATPGAEKLTADELEAAKTTLAAAPSAERAPAWRDVIDEVGSHMDPQYLATLKQELNADPGSVRAQNNYVATILQDRVESSGLSGRIGGAAQLEAGKEAMRKAMSAQVKSEKLLELVDRVITEPEFAFLKAAWPKVVSLKDGKSTIDDKTLTQLTNVFREVQHRQPGEKAMASFVDRVAGAGDTSFPSTVPGFDKAGMQQKVAAVFEQQHTAALVIDPKELRVGAYQKTIDALYADKDVQALLRDIKRKMKDSDIANEIDQAAQAGLVLNSETMELAVAQPYARALYDLTQRTGKAMGISKEVDLVLTPSPSPNAYIFTADADAARVAVFTSLAEKFWDDAKGDWLTISVDKDGKPVDDNAPGARSVKVGEKLMEAVLAHELGHIRDEVVQHKTAIIALFLATGTNMLASSKAKDVSAEDKTKFEQLLGSFGSCPCGVHQIPSEKFFEQLKAAGLPSKEKAEAAITRIAEAMNVEAPNFKEGLSFGAIMEFLKHLKKLTRISEATADRHAIALQGAPEWTALVHSMFALDLTVDPSSELKLDSLKRLMKMGPERYADLMLEQLAKADDAPSVDEVEADRTHPASPGRIKHAYLFTQRDEDYFKKLEEFRALDPDQQVLGVLQKLETEAAAWQKSLDKLKPLDGARLTEDLVAAQRLKQKKQAVVERMAPYLAILDQAIDAAGLSATQNPFFDRAVAFMRAGGAKVARDKVFDSVRAHLTTRLQAVRDKGELEVGAAAIVAARLEVLDKLGNDLDKSSKKSSKKDDDDKDTKKAAA